MTDSAPRICASGKVSMTATDAKNISGLRRRHRKCRRAYHCTICRQWHLCEPTKISRSVLDKFKRRRLRDEAEIDDYETEL
jgi:tRNA G26 N,N-dimethylase Trm1